MASIAATYDYCDETGCLRYQAVRMEPKDFRQRRPIERTPTGVSAWAWNMEGVQRVLYRLPELNAADPEEVVYVVEGEKDVNNLTAIGCVATTNVGGAGKWKPEYSEALRGRHVVILPDNDAPGKKHAASVLESLRPIASSVAIVNLPDLPLKGDVSDWLAVQVLSPERNLKGQLIEAVSKQLHEVVTEPSCSEPEPLCFPTDCIDNAGGLLAEIIKYDLSIATFPQPVLALLGALCIMSVLTGRKVRSSTNLRTNLYALGIAGSAAGKSGARSVIKRVLIETKLELLGNDRIGSHAGIISLLNEQPSVLMPIDEIGDLLGSMKEGGFKSGQTKSIEPVLKQLYSEAGSVFCGDAYADTKRKRVIDQPHLVLFGSCPNEDFWENITSKNVSGGFIGRFIVLEGLRDVLPVHGVVDQPPPREILDRAKAWANWVPPSPVPVACDMAFAHPTPVTLTMAPAALEMLHAHQSAIFQRRVEEDERTRAIWGRCAEKTIKLAMLRACSLVVDPSCETLAISEADMAWGKKLAIYTTRLLVGGVGSHVADEAEERVMKKILKVIRAGGEEGVTQSEICRQVRGKLTRERALADLRESGTCYFKEEKIRSNTMRIWFARGGGNSS